MARRDTPARRAQGRAAQRRYYERNKARFREQYDRVKHRDWWLRRNYGISLVEWDALFEAQIRRCAICGSASPSSTKGWHTDHDHVSGKVRGILCHPCNTTLGRLEKAADGLLARLRRIEEYVR